MSQWDKVGTHWDDLGTNWDDGGGGSSFIGRSGDRKPTATPFTARGRRGRERRLGRLGRGSDRLGHPNGTRLGHLGTTLGRIGTMAGVAGRDRRHRRNRRNRRKSKTAHKRVAPRRSQSRRGEPLNVAWLVRGSWPKNTPAICRGEVRWRDKKTGGLQVRTASGQGRKEAMSG
jgi:hypothetical protein